MQMPQCFNKHRKYIEQWYVFTIYIEIIAINGSC